MTHRQPIDRDLDATLYTLPKLPFLRMLQQQRTELAALRKAFLEKGTLPIFHYAKALRFDADAYLARLADVRAAIGASPAHATLVRLYDAKCHELALRARCIVAVQKGDDAAVTACAKELFGVPNASVEDLEKELTHMIAHAKKARTKGRMIDAVSFETMAHELFAYYGLQEWRTKIVARHTVHVGHGKRGRSPLLRIPRTLHISPRRAAQILTHEIEVHALRHANGTQSGLLLLARGTAGYIATDEGLAMFFAKKLSRMHTHTPGFWETYTTALAMRYGFAETYAHIRDARLALATAMQRPHAERLAEDAAWRLCLRTYRGITRPGKTGLYFSRDHVYRTGFETVGDWIEKNGEGELSKLFAGHMGIHDLPTLAELGIPHGRTPNMHAHALVRAHKP